MMLYTVVLCTSGESGDGLHKGTETGERGMGKGEDQEGINETQEMTRIIFPGRK
jgi:hypothetical protein